MLMFGIVAGSMTFAGCSNDGDDKKIAPDAGSGSPLCSVTETIDVNISSNKTIAQGACIGLSGVIHVTDTVTLTVGKGARILANTSAVTALVIDKGAKIEATGDASNPIVFTSGANVGSRAGGDWGGIVIHGKAQVNAVNDQDTNTDTEFTSGPYGGTTNTDDSGTLKYVRIEFGGKKITAGTKEYNGLSLFGVGSGTKIDYVQFHKGTDDGIEFFGGAVDAKHIISSWNEDDALDWTEGWRGTVQFALLLPENGESFIEGDGGKDINGPGILSKPVLANLTVLGNGNAYKYGMAIRVSGGIRLYNSIIGSLTGRDFAIDGSSTGSTRTFNSVLIDNTSTNSAGAVYSATTTFCEGKEAGVVTTSNQFSSDCAAATPTYEDLTTSTIVTDTSLSFAALPAGITKSSTRWCQGGLNDVIPTASVTSPAPTLLIAGDNTTTPTTTTYVGAFDASDTWANTWTSFPVN